MKATTEVAVTLTDEPWNRLGADARTSATSIRAIEVRGRRHRKCRPAPALDAGVQAEPGNMAYFTNCGRSTDHSSSVTARVAQRARGPRQAHAHRHGDAGRMEYRRRHALAIDRPWCQAVGAVHRGRPRVHPVEVRRSGQGPARRHRPR